MVKYIIVYYIQALIQDFVREGSWLSRALLGGSRGMLPQKIFKVESARLA